VPSAGDIAWRFESASSLPQFCPVFSERPALIRADDESAG
jgi:hypothetical protein